MTAHGNIAILNLREYARPPKPSVAEPFAQVRWIFDTRGARAGSKSTRDNYQSAKTFFIHHVEKLHGRSPYYLSERWDEFALLRFKGELLDRIDSAELSLSSFTLSGHFSAVRQVMKEAAAYGLLHTRTIQEVHWGDTHRETDTHISYSDKEIGQIIDAVAFELQLVNEILSGYKKQPPGVGRDPRVNSRRGVARGYGFKSEPNMRWYFENVLGGRPVIGVGTDKTEHRNFLASAFLAHGGLHEMYRRWGVCALVDESLVMPLAMELQLLTGLNPSSLLALKVDCLREEHPLTGMPYLLYVKDRSFGEKELHLPLLDARAERSLRGKQSLQVGRVVKKLLVLTERARRKLSMDDPLRQFLFIYESGGPRTHGKILPLTNKQTSTWCMRMQKKHSLCDDKGRPLSFNLVRFRSTKLTEMALAGRDIFEIQQVAGHKNIRTTHGYIAKRRLDFPARKKIADAIEQIQVNRSEFDEKAVSIETKTHPVRLHKGLLSDCKNVFDPPAWVRRAADYVPGQACTRFNMCLFCKNVVVFAEHLPVVAAYRGQILADLDNNIQDLPNESLYRDSLSVLDFLLDPDDGPFTAQDVEWALEIAVTLDVVIDPLLYRGSCQ